MLPIKGSTIANYLQLHIVTAIDSPVGALCIDIERILRLQQGPLLATRRLLLDVYSATRRLFILPCLNVFRI